MTTFAHRDRVVVLISLAPRVLVERLVLVTLELIVAGNAVGGAIYGLAGAKSVPREWLRGTPFHSYLVPSLILLVAVGGSTVLAATALLVRHRLAPEASFAAGLVLICWIATQMLIIVPGGDFSWLQPAMFAVGLTLAVLAVRLRRDADPRPR